MVPEATKPKTPTHTSAELAGKKSPHATLGDLFACSCRANPVIHCSVPVGWCCARSLASPVNPRKPPSGPPVQSSFPFASPVVAASSLLLPFLLTFLLATLDKSFLHRLHVRLSFHTTCCAFLFFLFFFFQITFLFSPCGPWVFIFLTYTTVCLERHRKFTRPAFQS